jgi:hypothetical protein
MGRGKRPWKQVQCLPWVGDKEAKISSLSFVGWRQSNCNNEAKIVGFILGARLRAGIERG